MQQECLGAGLGEPLHLLAPVVAAVVRPSLQVVDPSHACRNACPPTCPPCRAGGDSLQDSQPGGGEAPREAVHTLVSRRSPALPACQASQAGRLAGLLACLRGQRVPLHAAAGGGAGCKHAEVFKHTLLPVCAALVVQGPRQQGVLLPAAIQAARSPPRRPARRPAGAAAAATTAAAAAAAVPADVSQPSAVTASLAPVP